jgi:hypothetical protein
MWDPCSHHGKDAVPADDMVANFLWKLRFDSVLQFVLDLVGVACDCGWRRVPAWLVMHVSKSISPHLTSPLAPA